MNQVQMARKRKIKSQGDMRVKSKLMKEMGMLKLII